MNWDVGYSASYYMTTVDPITWNDLERIEIVSGSINRATTGLRHSADVTCINYSPGERYVRIYLDVRQSDSGAHEPLFTGLTISPSQDIRGSWYERKIQCYSVLKPASDVILARGWYVSKDISCATVIKQLLEPVKAPIVFEDSSATLDNPLVAQAGETNLSMVENILEAMNWNLRIGGDGRITIGEYTKDPIAIFDAINFDVIETKVQVERDWYDCPNVFMAVTSYATAIAKDEDEDSPLSIQNRGREIWMYEDNCAVSMSESLDEYAKRRLKQEQQYLTSISYDRRYVPGVMPGDIISLRYPAQGLSGDYVVNTQNINLGYSARTSEKVIGIE